MVLQLSTRGATIKTALFGEVDTNNLNDVLLVKLNGIEAGATAGGNSAADGLFPYIFLASDKTGVTDMATEFETAMLAAAGRTMYIPEGTYFFKSANVAGDIRVVASPRAIFLNDYLTDDDARCIRQRNAETSGSPVDILDIDNMIWFFSENTTRIRVADASTFARDDIVHIHSQNGAFTNDLLEGSDIRRVGQSGRIAEVDLVNDYIYLYGALEWVPQLVTNPKIRKYSTRVFEWDGGVFKYKTLANLTDPTQNDQGFRRPNIEIYGTPFVNIKNVKFEYCTAQNIMLRSCPYSHIHDNWHYGSPNLRLPTEAFVSRTGTYSISSTAVTVSSTSTSSIAVGKAISGTGIPAGTYITAYSHPNLTLSQATTAAGTAQTLSIELKYFVTGVSKGTNIPLSATTTIGSTTITMTNTTGLAVGQEVTGTGIVANSFILSITANTSIVINEAATATGTITLTAYQGLIITVSAADTLANGDVVMLDGLGGMTEGNSRFYTVIEKSGTTFKLYDYFGGGALNPSSSSQLRLLSGQGWGTYTSGGTVRETGSGDTLLSYGVQLYGSCCFSVIERCVFINLRHGVTSDGISGGTYSATEWPNYGSPNKVQVRDCHAFDTHGVAFDTHQEGLNWQFINCHAVNANRGPFWQTSYVGTHFQDRSGSTTFLNCSAIGGVYGFRISAHDFVQQSEGRLINCTVTNNRSLSDEDGIGVIFTPEITNALYVHRYIINNLTVTGCGTGIDCRTTSSASSAGTGLDIITNGVYMNGVKVTIDTAPNVNITHLGDFNIDTTKSVFTGSHYGVRMRSTADLSSNVTKTSGSAVLTGINIGTLKYDGQTGNFTVAQVITGGTSGATATIVSDSDSVTSGTLTLSGITGTFVDNETITDPVTGSALVNGVVTTRFIIGSYVIGTGIPTGAKIKSINSATQITLDVAAFSTGSVTGTIRSTSTVNWLGDINIRENHEHPLTALMYASDSSATKYYTLPTSSVKCISVGINMKTFTDANVTIATETVAITGHGFVNREQVRLKTVSGTSPTGLTMDTSYYVYFVDANSIRFYTDRALTVIVNITATGTGTTSIQRVPMIATGNSTSSTDTLTTYPDYFVLA